MTLRFQEKDGTFGNDVLVGSSNTISFGYSGNDTFVATTSPIGAEFFIGGTGNNTYVAAPNSLMVVAGEAHPQGVTDNIIALGLGSANTKIATIDGRHLLGIDTGTLEAVLILDWFSPQNHIDNIQTANGVMSFETVLNFVTTTPVGVTFLGNLSLAQAALIPAGETAASVNEAISYYENRAASLAKAPAISPLEQVLVDPNFYLSHNADVSVANLDPAQHFTQFGWHDGRNPDAFFDVAFYLSHNPDVAAAGIDPLLHYAVNGWKEGRDPSAAFSTNHYLAVNPDVRLAGLDPLQHYLQFGIAEHRSI